MDARRKTGLVAVVDFGSAIMLKTSKSVARPPVSLGHSAMRDLLGHRARAGQVRVLLPSLGSVSSLGTLQRKDQVNSLGFAVPQNVDDQMCVLFSNDSDEFGRLLQQFDQVFVASTQDPKVYEVVTPLVEARRPEPVGA